MSAKSTGSTWAVHLPPSETAALAGLRLLRGVEAAATTEGVWLRGREMDDALDRALRALPLSQRFDVLSDGTLRPAGRLVPSGRLPVLEWQPVAALVAVSLPTKALAGRLVAKSPLRLVRSAGERPSNVLLASLESFVAYVDHAPGIRFRGCRFAVRRDGCAVVHGAPLPPISGERFVEEKGVAIPAGWEWMPRVAEGVIAEAWEIAAGELLLCHPGQPAQRIAAEQFSLVTRSAVRESWEVLKRG